MLRLKNEISKINKTTIFVAGRKKIIFDPLNVKQEEYPYYKSIGFNIFRCESCECDSCFGDCENEEIIDIQEEEGEEKDIIEDIEIEIIVPEYSITNEDIEIEIIVPEDAIIKDEEKKCATCGVILTDKRRKYCTECK
jgi:ABC-type uncharacterized transport system ATPase subunit